MLLEQLSSAEEHLSKQAQLLRHLNIGLMATDPIEAFINKSLRMNSPGSDSYLRNLGKSSESKSLSGGSLLGPSLHHNTGRSAVGSTEAIWNQRNQSYKPQNQTAVHDSIDSYIESRLGGRLNPGSITPTGKDVSSWADTAAGDRPLSAAANKADTQAISGSQLNSYSEILKKGKTFAAACLKEGTLLYSFKVFH